jgi:hypothetical protein
VWQPLQYLRRAGTPPERCAVFTCTAHMQGALVQHLGSPGTYRGTYMHVSTRDKIVVHVQGILCDNRNTRNCLVKRGATMRSIGEWA